MCDAKLKKEPWQVRFAIFLIPFGVDAMTLGHIIFSLGKLPDKLLCHERVHVEQYERLGFFGFLRQYLREYREGKKAGKSHQQAYLDISLEVEARQRAGA